MSDASRIRRAYDGSLVSYRALVVAGWGPLANLGYYPLWALPLLAGGLSWFQRKLARKAIQLLDPQPGERVLDVATGHGWTASTIARKGAHVLGIDLLPENVAEARSAHPDATFGVADATRLPERLEDFELGPESLDRILCLEAAFEFGAKGRRDFLEESFRLLRPGGRLVIVDFTWPDDRPQDIALHDPEGLVRETWQFDEFEPLERYRRNAREIGFRELRILDWSAQVTKRFVAVCWTITYLAQSKVGRFAYAIFRPGVFRIWNDDWVHLMEVMRAHQSVQRASTYTALVLEKPAG